ncbi:MAG: hypothetical protein ACI4TT_03045 [Christensenellales bacterium]
MFEMFSWQHILYILFFVAFTIGIIFLSRFLIKKDKKWSKILVVCMALLTFGFMLANKIEIWIKYDHNFQVFVPGSFCSALAFWGPIFMIICKPNSKFLQFGMFGMALGGMLTTVYPEFLIGEPSIFIPVGFTGIVYHTLMFVSFVYVLGIGYFKPTMKNWWSFVLGMALMVPYVLFNSQVLGASEDMYLFAPAIEGTQLYWWLIGILATLLYTVFLLIFEQFAFKKEERFLNTTINKVAKFFGTKCKAKQQSANTTQNAQQTQAQQNKQSDALQQTKDEQKSE